MIEVLLGELPPAHQIDHEQQQRAADEDGADLQETSHRRLLSSSAEAA